MHIQWWNLFFNFLFSWATGWSRSVFSPTLLTVHMAVKFFKKYYQCVFSDEILFFSISHLVGPVNCPEVFPSNLWANIHPLLKPLFRLVITWNGRWSRYGPDIIFSVNRRNMRRPMLLVYVGKKNKSKISFNVKMTNTWQLRTHSVCPNDVYTRTYSRP